MNNHKRHRFIVNNFISLFVIVYALGLTILAQERDMIPTRLLIGQGYFLMVVHLYQSLTNMTLQEQSLAVLQIFFSPDPKDRIYGVWMGLDRRAAMTLQKETAKHIGRNLNLVVNGTVIGFHPIRVYNYEWFYPIHV